MDMLCIMHQAEPEGYLLLNGETVTPDKLAVYSGCNADVTSDCMDELVLHGVASVTDQGIFYCRRMVRDAEKRGGTRDRVRKHREKQKSNDDSNATVTPVLEASNHKPIKETAFPDVLNTSKFKTAWDEWIEYRKQSKLRKMKPVTIVKQLKEMEEWGEAKAILSINASIRNAWQGLFEPASKQTRRDTSRPIQTQQGSTSVEERYRQLGRTRPESPEEGEE